MSLLDFDKSFYKRIKSLYDEVVYASPEEAYKVNARSHQSRVLMPFISVWRLPDITVNSNMYNDPFVRRGALCKPKGTKGVEFVNDKNVSMHGLPVTLTYQIDVYATKREVCDGITTEILLDFYENPYLDVTVEGLGEQSLCQYNVEIDESVSDNTDISGFDETTRVYRLTITATIPEALIYRISKSKKPIETVEISLAVMGIDDETDYEETIEQKPPKK